MTFVMSLKGCFVVFIGLPGSGKTTLCNSLVQDFHNDYGSWQVHEICFDELIDGNIWDSLNDETCMKSWKSERNLIEQKCEKIILEIIKNHDGYHDSQNLSLNSGNTSPTLFFIDDNMYYSSMRYSWYQLARKFRFGFCQVYLQCTIESSLKRNRNRNVSAIIPDNVIVQMDKKLEEPNQLKNSWEKSTITIEVDLLLESNAISKIKSLIFESIENPVLPLEDTAAEKELSQLQCLQNINHQCDQMFRKIIGEIMKNEKNNKGVDLYKNLSSKKNTIMKAIRDKEIAMPPMIFKEDLSINQFELKEFLSTLLKS